MSVMAFFAVALSSVHAQVNYQIHKIKFQGNKTFKKNVLVENISIYELTFTERLFKRKEPSFYNEEMIQADVERLIRFYQSQGFLYVNIKLLPPDINEEKHRVNVTFDITENNPILVDSISYSIVNTTYQLNEDSIQRRIERRTELKQNKRFTDAQLSADIAKINFALGSVGYPYVQTNYDLNIRPEERKTDVNYTINPGPRGRFDTTSVTGNRYVSTKFIKRQLKYNQGDIFSEKKIEDTRRNLYDLQTFRIVSISPQINTATRDSVIPVTVVIKEQPRLSTEFGVGYGTEEKFRAYSRITYRGLFGGARQLKLYAKHSAIEPYYISLSFIEPRFLSDKLSLTVSPYLQRQIEPGYDVKILGINTPLNYKFNQQFNATIAGYYERISLLVRENKPDVVVPDEGKLTYDKYGALGNVLYTTAYPVISPDRGFSARFGAKTSFLKLRVDYHGDYGIEKVNYNKLWLDLRKYNRLGNSFTLALRGMIGGIFSTDTLGFVPSEDLFYSGGSNSIRGWARSMLGPIGEDGKPLGGKSILEMNVEIRRPLFWLMEGALFFDAGNVWGAPFRYSFNQLSYSVGGGLRFNTPIGPIRLDIGFPINNVKRNPQFFINVGQAF